MIVPVLALLLAAAQTQTPLPPIGQRTAPPEAMLQGLNVSPDAEEEAAAAAAARFPLGTIDNPVRVGGPDGERNYLARLRCTDGSRPRIGPRVQGGAGGFGSTVAAYSAECPGAPSATIMLDMYHEEHREDQAPAGFTLAAH
jgi:hypothetical protein